MPNITEDTSAGWADRTVRRRARPDTVDVVHYLADKGPGQVPGVVLAGVVIGVLLLWAAIRGMFGKRK
ncbi:MAG TPA: hypothetical protein VH442_09475 [Micromonosporaceae bacterium]|jgi:hypothetical protein